MRSRFTIRCLNAIAIVSLLACSIPLPHSSAAPTKYDPEDGYHQYIKYSSVASKAAHDRYPKASLVDLLYVGCKAERTPAKQFVYKFWMQEGAEEFGVYVTVAAGEQPGQSRVTLVEKTDVRIPSYGQWGRYAAKAVSAKYPDAEIVGYKPFGCEYLSRQASRQVFRFWIRQTTGAQLIRVVIDYNAETGRALAVKFEPVHDF